MNIFIDESGVFKPDHAKPQSIACVGAAIIPGRSLDAVQRRYRRLSRDWPRSDKGEIKGRLLGERHVAALCELLEPAHVLFEASVMDMNLLDDADIDRHKAVQAARFTENLTGADHPEAVKRVRELRRTQERMHRQLYAQAVALTDVAWKAAQYGQFYFRRRFPGELARFRWVIDAKEKRRTTRYERWWRTSVAPLLRSRFLQDPMITPAGGDHSALRRDVPGGPMPEDSRQDGDGPKERADDLAAIIGRDVEFATSDAHVGLQIADILTNALRRALLGHLQPGGWQALGRLILHRPQGALRLIDLGPRRGSVDRPYTHVLEALNRTGRSMPE